MKGLRRDFLIILVVMAVIGTVIVVFQPTRKVTFFDLHVVNDTNQTVTVQPCWDVDCLTINGLPASVLRPGRSVHSTGNFPTDTGAEIVVGIRKPGGKPWQIASCMMIGTAPGEQTGVVRVSRARPCFTGTEP